MVSEIESELLEFNVTELGQFSLEPDDIDSIQRMIKKKRFEISTLKKLKFAEERALGREERILKQNKIIPLWITHAINTHEEKEQEIKQIDIEIEQATTELETLIGRKRILKEQEQEYRDEGHKTTTVGIIMNNEFLNILDTNRGQIKRSRYINNILRNHFKSNKPFYIPKRRRITGNVPIQVVISLDIDLFEMIEKKRRHMTRSSFIFTILKQEMKQEAN